MVRLQKLLATNFKLLNFNTPLIFPDGILAIQGLNEAGKSTVLETILYALYGRTIKAPRGEKKTLIRYKARTALIQLWIEVQQKTYQITRKIQLDKPTEATLHVVHPDESLSRLASGVTAVDAEIIDLLDGIRFDDLVASNVVAQKDLNGIANLGRLKRIQIINALLNRGCFDNAVVTLKQQKKELEQTLQVEQSVLERLQSEATTYRQKQQEQAQLNREIKHLMELIESLSKRVDQLNQHINLLERYRIAEQQKNELVNSKKAELELLENSIKNLKEIEQKEEELEKIHQMLNDLITVEDADRILKLAEEKLIELSEIEPRIRILEENISEIHQDIKELEKYKDSEKIAREKEDCIETLESRKQAYLKSPTIIIPLLITLGSSISLFAMGSPLYGIIALILTIGLAMLFAKKIRSEWSQIDRSIVQEKTTLRKIQEQVAEYARKPKLEQDLSLRRQELTHKNEHRVSIEIDAEKVLSSLPEGYKINQEKKLKTQVGEVRQKIDANINKKKQYLLRSSDLEKDIDKKNAVQADIENRRITIQELDAKISKIRFPVLPEGLIFSDETLESNRKQLSDTKSHLDTNIGSRTIKQEQLDTVVTYLEENAGIIEKAQEKEQKVANMTFEIRVASRTIDCVNKVAENARKKVRPQAQIYMGRLLNKITNGKYKAAKLDEDYNLDVFSDEAGEFIDKSLFSGGTEDQFLLGLRLAFALSILPQEKGTHLQFIFLDEPFAGSDKERRSNILELINQELLQNFKQIIIVSHQDDVLEASPNILRLVNGRIS